MKSIGRELCVTPRPLAYNYHARFRPALGHILAYAKLTVDDFFFVQVGANNGKRADPIHQYVEQFGLRGVLVEPQPELFSELQETYKNRSDLKFVQAAIGPKDGTLELHRVKPSTVDRDFEYGLGSLKREVVESHLRGAPNSHCVLEKIQVRAIHPLTLRRELGIRAIHFLQVDVEGYDYEVLKLFDIGAILPFVIHFEHMHLSTRDYEECLRWLVSLGYAMSFDGSDTLACHRSFLSQE